MSPRIIEWCQGNTYELAAASDGLDVAVVISHDCDLRSEKETNVEIIRSAISRPQMRRFNMQKTLGRCTFQFKIKLATNAGLN